MNRIDKFFYLATEEAKHSDMYHKHGAVLVKGGIVIAKGHNSRGSMRLGGENHWYTASPFVNARNMLSLYAPKSHFFPSSTHAEMDSLYRFKAGQELKHLSKPKEERK
jgi:deoxycytidylate deaminase